MTDSDKVGMSDKTASQFMEASPKVFEGFAMVEDHWDRVGEAPCKGWIWMTPVGAIPLQPMNGDEVLQFLEEMTKPRPEVEG
jgi:hypothetical protein